MSVSKYKDAVVDMIQKDGGDNEDILRLVEALVMHLKVNGAGYSFGDKLPNVREVGKAPICCNEYVLEVCSRDVLVADDGTLSVTPTCGSLERIRFALVIYSA